MIPVKLKLSNFTSYGHNPPELDFTKFHMAAISGSNGAGKSSLLDAITWCVWGSSRLGDTSDQLIKLGQTEMHVEFSFDLDNHIYTVKRKRIKKAGGSTSLELFSGAHNLTEGTMKTTQQKIVDILHLTYETFVNSAFLRQGHADEFTTKGATDRKRILADILGLSHYDELEEKAKEKIKEAQTKLQLLEYQLLEIEAELSLKEEREKALTKAEKEAESTEKQLKEAEQQIKLLEKDRELISSKLQTLEESRQRIEDIQKELDDLKLQIILKEKAKTEYQAILEKKVEIETNYQTLQKLQEHRKELEIKRSKLISAKSELAILQKTLSERETKRSVAITKLELELKRLQTENDTLQKHIDHLKEHKDTCPTCGQTIGQSKNQEIIGINKVKSNQNNLEIKGLEEKMQNYRSVVLPEQKLIEEKEADVGKLDKETTHFTQLATKIYQLEKLADLYLKLQQADIAIKTHQESIKDLQKIIDGKQSQIGKEIESLNQLADYKSQLEEIKRKLGAKDLVKLDLSQKALELRGKVGEVKQLVTRARQLEDLLSKRKKEKLMLQKEREAFEELALAFGKKGIQAMIIETAIPEIEKEANILLDRLTEGRMRVALATQKETKTLRQGFGQAKVPGIIETLDIIISDEMGERPYESWSGGEKFRVDLSIRLALSKLLTNRAGSQLQFLVIDEGFGTQDAQGISRIVGAINSIKDDFEKILIITHLDELKEEFPVRIEVTKGPIGSTFEVIGV